MRRRRAPRDLHRKGAQLKMLAMMEQAAIECPSLRFERVHVLGDVRHELRLDVRDQSFAENLLEAIGESRSERWRKKTSARAARLSAAACALRRDLSKREPVKERLGADRWHWTAIDDAGRRVLVAEVHCAVPRSFSDPCPVVVKIKAPQLLLDGKMMRRAAENRIAA